nr:hypothetical protein [Rhodococcus sp. 15-1154-1]
MDRSPWVVLREDRRETWPEMVARLGLEFPPITVSLWPPRPGTALAIRRAATVAVLAKPHERV